MFSTKTFAVVLVAFSATSALAADCARQATVQEGEICDTFSAAHQVSTYQLAVVNQGHIDAACSNLMPGDTLCLGYPGEDCSDTYVVQENDTCDHISSAHGLNSTILSLNNPQIDDSCSNIYIGEVLCVSQSVQVPPAPAGDLPAATIPATATPAVPSATKAPAVPSPTEAPAVHTTTKAPVAPSATNTPAPSQADDDDDDEDLPYCDDE